MDRVLQVTQTQGRRGSLVPSCRFRRARTMGSSRQLSLMTAQFYPASHRYRYDGDHGFPPRHARHRVPYVQTHDLLLWQPIHPVKFYLHLEGQPNKGLGL